MKKKLILALMLSASMVFTACGSSNSTNTSSSESSEKMSDEASASQEASGKEESAQIEDETANGQNADKTADDDVIVMTYAEYAAADLDTEVVVETYVQAKQSWWDETATIYTQDKDGAYFLYNITCSEEDYELLVPGTKIRVNGYKSEWSGEIEIIDAAFEIIDDGDTYIAEPLDVTEVLSEDSLINYQNQYVSFFGMTVEASTDADGNDAAFLYSYDGSGTHEGNSDLYFNVSCNGETYTFTVESYLCNNTTDVYAAVENLQIGDTITMEGFLYWYNGVNPHITSVEVH